MALKKAIITVMLSALLVSSTAVPIYAVDDTSKANETEEVLLEEEEDEGDDYDPWGEDSELEEESEEESSEISEISEESEESQVSEQSQVSENSEESSKEESNVQEESKEESKVQEQSKEESKVQEQSKEESSKEESKEESSKQDDIKKDMNTIGISVDFNCPGISNLNRDNRIDFSKVEVKLVSADKKTVIKRIDLADYLDNWKLTVGFSTKIKVPEWAEGSKYILIFDNLPDVFTSETQEYELVYREEENLHENGDKIIAGIDYDLSVKLDVKDFNVMVFVYDTKDRVAKNVVVDYLLKDGEKIVYAGSNKTTESGCVFFKVGYDLLDEFKTYTLELSVPYAFNGYVCTGKNVFDYVRSISNVAIYTLRADATEEELYFDEDGTRIASLVDVPINVKYGSAYDMKLFKNKNFQLNLYTGNEISTIVNVSNENTVNNVIHSSDGTTLTLKGDSFDYKLRINPVTLKVKSGASVNIEAIPQLSLQVINEKDGVKSRAHFKISGSDLEYNEIYHKFAVNYGESYTITNLDTNDIFTVNISKYKDTVVNIADGDTAKSGYVGNDVDNINNDNGNDSNSSNDGQNNVYNVPKTGDIVFGIILSLVGVTGLSYIGYLYFKRKEKKHNEIKR